MAGAMKLAVIAAARRFSREGCRASSTREPQFAHLRLIG